MHMFSSHARREVFLFPHLLQNFIQEHILLKRLNHRLPLHPQLIDRFVNRIRDMRIFLVPALPSSSVQLADQEFQCDERPRSADSCTAVHDSGIFAVGVLYYPAGLLCHVSPAVAGRRQ